VKDLDWAAAYRREDLLPDDREVPGEEVETPAGLMRAVGPQHIVSGTGTLCGIPLGEVEVMPFLFSSRYRNLCLDCCRMLGDGEEVSVTAHADSPDASLVDADRDHVGDFSVTFSDNAAQQRNLVERSLAIIQDFPGVERAVQEDRELIYGWGRSVDLEALHDALVTWWEHQV
jgi:hypothetical protein